LWDLTRVEYEEKDRLISKLAKSPEVSGHLRGVAIRTLEYVRRSTAESVLREILKQRLEGQDGVFGDFDAIVLLRLQSLRHLLSRLAENGDERAKETLKKLAE
jgi:hypothetical protein